MDINTNSQGQTNDTENSNDNSSNTEIVAKRIKQWNRYVYTHKINFINLN